MKIDTLEEKLWEKEIRYERYMFATGDERLTSTAITYDLIQSGMSIELEDISGVVWQDQKVDEKASCKEAVVKSKSLESFGGLMTKVARMVAEKYGASIHFEEESEIYFSKGVRTIKGIVPAVQSVSKAQMAYERAEKGLLDFIQKYI